jgi:membrane protease YdiL (CAAX protease family)
MEAIVIFVYLIAGTVAYFLKFSNLALYGLANLGLTFLVAATLTRMGWWKPIGFVAPRRRGDLLYFLVPFIPMVINLIPGVEVTSLLFVSQAFAITLLVGFAEESIFRGLMLNALKPRGLWKAAIITAVLFGLTHAMNAITGKDMLSIVMQICYAAAIGFAYAALVLKKGNLWLLVLAHILIDFVNFIQKPGFTLSSFWQSSIIGFLTIIFTGYGIYIMQQKTTGEKS